MHKEFAEIYDIFMKYVDYDGWYNFLKRFIKIQKNNLKKLLTFFKKCDTIIL